MEKTPFRQKAVNLISVAKQYWHTPAKGNYVPYKEVVAFGAAGFGVHWVTLLASTIGLDASNFLVGASIGLEPLHLQYMLIIANLVGIPIGMWRGWYTDNHNMKGGKFLPFLTRCPIPLVVISTVMVWLPFENWSYITKAVVVWCFYMLLQVFLCFYNESFQNIQYVLTPNAQERANIMSIFQIIYSLAPTISGFAIPFVAGLTWGLTNIWSYRVIYPVFTVPGVIVSLIFFKKVKERIVLPKKKAEPVRIIDAFREVSKNKYFWITQGASWVGFLENAFGVVLNWTFVYAYGGARAYQLGIANTVIGNSALWAMMFAPFAIRLLGKRNLLILGNVVNVVLLVFLYQVYQDAFFVCVFWYLNNFVNVVNNNINIPNIYADIRDYHQWKTGVRIDGLFSALGIIGTVISFGTGLVIPSVYEKMGLKTDYNVLFDDTLRNNLFEVLIVFSIVGAILNLIPYLFYDLTEVKHKSYVSVLKIRAMFEDYGENDLDDELLIEAMGIIENARECQDKTAVKTDRSLLKNARKLKKKTEEEKEIRKAEIKKAKEEIREQRELAENIFVSPFVLEELGKFSTLRYQKQLEAAKETYSKGTLCCYENLKEERKTAKALPKGTKEEKEIRSDALALIRKKKEAVKIIKKVGIENIKEPDEKIKEEILSREAHSLWENLKNRKELRDFMKNQSLFKRATSPYFTAKTLIEQSRNYAHFDEIEKRYGELKVALDIQ